ncbi:hypothetical protein [Sphingomonas sp. CROZ-RG-20F-R02-07]|uniref:hypothetical protein n=1 Tax=Sphingomonas sp. CROZ-RG-20F-R02-07 TaxID=2914832 RepID=UPI001F56A9DE|nr:hypothetical protein [Sphingomonas sp. CROZ-RG-20F-R02-07]
MLIIVVAVLVSVVMTAFLSFARFTHRDAWRATVTPLASIIGSGFLIAGPLLAKDFGGAAIGAMAVLLLLAYAVGAVVRFNIVHVEDFVASARLHDPVQWLGRVTQVVLSVAYAISVAYYLKLLAEFALKPLAIDGAWHVVIANGMVTAILLLLTGLAFGGDLRRVEHVAHGTVSLKIGIIAGLLVALALWWAIYAGATAPLPPVRVSLGSVPMLLGLLITVQGFETSRYLGHAYPQDMRIATMRRAQIIASIIYLAFLGLLTPLLGRAAHTQGVAGILDVMALVAPGLSVLVLVAALASQLSAAVADSIGSGGLMSEVTRRTLSVPAAFALANALSVAVVWLTDPLQVVAISSRAFAIYYALQCALAVAVSRRSGAASMARQAGFVAIGIVCVVAALVGAPAE